MYKKYSTQFDRPMVIIYPGEYYATREDEVIHTVLGSCVSACIFDRVNKVAGMNHFMLPGSIKSKKFFIEKSSRYGMFAMELLINELLKLGGNKKKFKAKIFGGGHIIGHYRKSDGNVPQSNIRFIREYLAAESIPIISEDMGGENGRKLYFFTDDVKVLLTRIKKLSFASSTADEKEERYKIKVFKDMGPKRR